MLNYFHPLFFFFFAIFFAKLCKRQKDIVFQDAMFSNDAVNGFQVLFVLLPCVQCLYLCFTKRMNAFLTERSHF